MSAPTELRTGRENPLGDVVVDARWIAPTEGISARGWGQTMELIE